MHFRALGSLPLHVAVFDVMRVLRRLPSSAVCIEVGQAVP